MQTLKNTLSKAAARSSLALLGICMMTGCASGPRFTATRQAEPPPGKGLVYIYRTGSMLGAANSWKVFANDKQITTLPNAGFFPYVAEPGTVQFAHKLQFNALNYGLGAMVAPNAVAPKQELLRLDVVEGQTYFVKYLNGGGVNAMQRMEPEKALAEIAGCHQVLSTEEANSLRAQDSRSARR